MTDTYKAPPEQWKKVKGWASVLSPMSASAESSCILELRARVMALESQSNHIGDINKMVPPTVATDEELAPLLWVLWYHQGAKSHVGQPIRKYLGMGQFERMSDQQIEVAKRWAQSNSQASSREVAEPAPVAGGLVEWVTLAIDSAPYDEDDHQWDEGRAAILEVARWLREQGTPASGWAMRLEQEAGQ